MTGPVQGERTRQAWVRTSLASLVMAAVGFELAFDRGVVAVATTAVALLAAAGFAAVGQRRAVELEAAAPPPLRRRVVLAVTAAVVAVDAAGIALVLT